MPYQFEVYQDNAGEWRWRFKAPSGEIMADSGEGYTNKADCRNGLESVQKNAVSADVVEF